MPLDGTAEGGATQLVAGPGGAEAGAVDFDYAQALRGPGETEGTAWGRAGLLCSMGVLPPLDSAHLPARDVAHFVAAAGGDQASADAVHRAMDAAMARGDSGTPTHEDAATAAAGAACLRALHDALDALGMAGATSVAQEARAFRAAMGVPATAGARGAFALQALRAVPPPGPGGGDAFSPPRRGTDAAARSPLRRSPRLASQQTALTLVGDSPRSQTIRQLMAEKAAEAAARGG
eukprot:3945750-Pleurochrysis_carterae.AAC.1